MSIDPEELSAKRSAAAHSRWAKEQAQAHPLFPCEEGEKPTPIAWIQLRRYGVHGPVDCQRVWPAAELTCEDDLFQYFGGGVYELWGRAPLPNGQPGAIVKRRKITFEGLSKPFAGTEQVDHGASPSSSAAAAPTGDGRMDLFLAMMAEDRRDARAREERREAENRAADERRQAREDASRAQTTTLMVQGLQAVASFVAAIIARPPPPAPPPGPDLMPLLAQLIPKPDTGDAMDKVKKILEVAEKLKPETPAKTESLTDLMSGFGQAMGGIAQMEQMRIEAAKAGALAPGLPGGQESPAPGAATPAAVPREAHGNPTGNGYQHESPPGDDPGGLAS